MILVGTSTRAVYEFFVRKHFYMLIFIAVVFLDPPRGAFGMLSKGHLLEGAGSYNLVRMCVSLQITEDKSISDLLKKSKKNQTWLLCQGLFPAQITFLLIFCWIFRRFSPRERL